MSRITGYEAEQQVPPKVLLMYAAVVQLFQEGADVTNIRVSSITEKAGIGKGTAYEYFDTKEEIMVCAVVYHVQQVFAWLESELLKRDNFREQLDFLMEEMAKEDGRKYCFLRFVHMLTDSSELSRMTREKMQADEFVPYRPMAVFEKVLSGGITRGELRNDLPMEYMIYTLFSRLMAYMMTITTEEGLSISRQEMSKLVKTGILQELGTGYEK